MHKIVLLFQQADLNRYLCMVNKANFKTSRIPLIDSSFTMLVCNRLLHHYLRMYVCTCCVHTYLLGFTSVLPVSRIHTQIAEILVSHDSERNVTTVCRQLLQHPYLLQRAKTKDFETS